MKNVITSEITRFLITGAATLVIDYGVLIVLTEYLNVYYILSASVSFTLAVIVNYYICLKWVFKNSSKQNQKQFVLFVAASIVGLLINTGVMKLVVDFMRLHYFIAKLLATVIVTAWNYLTKKRSLELM